MKRTENKQPKKLTQFELEQQTFLLKELEYGMDISSNTIFLNSEISPESLYEVLARFNLLLKRIKMYGNVNKDVITFNVSSFGGDVYSMFGIHDYMRTFPIKISTVCVGVAMSAAAFLLASGGPRLITKNSTVMFHQFNSNMDGKTSDLIKNIKHVNDMQARQVALLASYTKKPSQFWEKYTKEDLYLTAEECLEYGVIDKII